MELKPTSKESLTTHINYFQKGRKNTKDRSLSIPNETYHTLEEIRALIFEKYGIKPTKRQATSIAFNNLKETLEKTSKKPLAGI